MNPTLNELRYFIAVVDNASFTRAADAIRISQPSLSRSIAELERSLGVELLERTTRSVRPTMEGAEFYEVAHEIVSSYDDGLGRFRAFMIGLRGEVMIAALPSLAASALPRIVARFSATHPDVQVRIREGNDADVLRLLRGGDADLALTDSGAHDDDLQFVELEDDPMVAVLHPDSPLAEHAELSWAQLAAHPFIAFSARSSVRRLTDLGFASAGVTPGRQLEAGAISTAAGFVAARLGNTAVPRTVVPLMAFTPLVVRTLAGPPVTRKLALHTRKRPTLPAAARELAALITRDGLEAHPEL